MTAYLWVALGSALGGVGRYGIGIAAGRLWGEAFPWGTILINMLGSFVIGFFGTLTTPDGLMPASANLRIFVMVGICGGFTTFSSFSLQTLGLAREGAWIGAMGNIALSVALCLMAVTLGHVSGERAGRLRSDAPTPPPAILAVLNRPETAQSVLAAAALVAARLGDRRIEVLHVRRDAKQGFMPTEEVMTAERAQEPSGEAARRAAELRAVFDAWRGETGAGAWREGTWRELAGAGLLVLGLAPSGEAREDIHAALFDARAGTLLVAEAAPRALGQHVAVGWKPSEATDRAIEAALPLLRASNRITVLIGSEDGHGDTFPDDLGARLGPVRVPVQVRRFDPGRHGIGTALLTEAHAAGADLLVMGAYGRGKLAEMILGGATREILAEADMPVLMRH